jgi:alkaline phosphatase
MKKYFRGVLALIVLFLLIVSCQPATSPETKTVPPTAEKPVNVILLIGDGMGLTQVSTTFYFKPDGPSNFQRFKYIGLINTSAANSKITDSAAGATAFACGVHTYNGALGVDTAKQSVMNIIEYLSPYQYETGLVATSSITHATPAAFYSHVPSRNMNEQIAEQLTTSEVDIFMGGGLQFFKNREDGKDMIQQLKDHQFSVFYDIDELPDLKPDQKYGLLAAPDGLPAAHQGRGDFLPVASEKTLKYLSAGDNPFFLMIEGSQIDWGGHENNAQYVIAEMLDFDKTIGEILDFAEKDGKTLVVVTADHETGGMALGANSSEEMPADYNQIKPSFSTGGHTATLIPVFAMGPGAEEFAGIYPNTDIYHKIVKLLDLQQMTVEK